jgi:hypothetical protein
MIRHLNKKGQEHKTDRVNRRILARGRGRVNEKSKDSEYG